MAINWLNRARGVEDAEDEFEAVERALVSVASAVAAACGVALAELDGDDLVLGQEPARRA